MNDLKQVSLDTIAEGASKELFERELREVAKNIADPNTSPTAKRQITLTFEFAPDFERSEVKVTVQAKAKLEPVKGFSKTVYMGKHNGAPTIYGQDTKQLNMFDNGVTELKKEGVLNA